MYVCAQVLTGAAAHDHHNVEEDRLLDVEAHEPRQAGATRKVGEREEEDQASERYALEGIHERHEAVGDWAESRDG